MAKHGCLVCGDPINPEDYERVGERFCSVACRDHWEECRGEDLAWLLDHLTSDAQRLLAWGTVKVMFEGGLYGLPVDELLAPPERSPDANDPRHGPVRVRRLTAAH